jgi:4'-phosphopantetheinyl transferase
MIVERECEMHPNVVAAPVLHHGEVHVWRQRLDCSPASVEAFTCLLSNEERYRAERFRFEEGRTEYIVSRGTLRVLLAAYQGTATDQLQFAYSEFGRPRLAVDGPEAIEFNISHSSGLTLLAFARHRRIGIDIEAVRTNFNPTEIAENYFSQSERTTLSDLPPGLRHQAFFRCWTRKEAFIKALGEGLSHPLDAFDVSLAPGETAALTATRPDSLEAARWTLRDVAVPGGYLAALAVELDSNPS